MAVRVTTGREDHCSRRGQTGMAKGNKVAMKLHLEEKKQCEEFTWSTHQGDLASPESGGGASYFPSELEDERASASEYESVEGEDWMEEWGAVTIQSLIRGYLARKRVRQWKKRRLRVSRMRRHRHRQSSESLKRVEKFVKVKPRPLAQKREQKELVTKTQSPSKPQQAPSEVRNALTLLSRMRREKQEKQKLFIGSAAKHATVIQKYARGRIARTHYRKLVIRKHVHDTKVELARRETLLRLRHASAIKIQSIVRGRRTRTKMSRLRRERRIKERQDAARRKRLRQELLQKSIHATKIQAIARGMLCRLGIVALVQRLEVEAGKKEQDAKRRKRQQARAKQHAASAVKIQAMYRGHQARKQRLELLHEQSALKIQSAYRGHQDRTKHKIFASSSLVQRDACGRTEPEADECTPAVRKKRRAPVVVNSELMQATYSRSCSSPLLTASMSPTVVATVVMEEREKAYGRSTGRVGKANKSKKVGSSSKRSSRIDSPQRAKQRFERRARINPMVDEPLYDFESLLSGLWEGESLDNAGNVTQITDGILRFYKDPSNGQAMIEGRAKTRCKNEVGVIVMHGVFDWGSSRCILVVEGKSCEGGYTYMGWVSPPSESGRSSTDLAAPQPSDSPETSALTHVDTADAALTGGHGVGYTMEASFQQYMFHLKKKQNTRRAEMRPIRQMIQNARSRANLGRPGSNDCSRDSARAKIANSPLVTTPEQNVEKMVTNVSAMLSNFRFQMEAVERRAALKGDDRGPVGTRGEASIDSVVALMAALEERLPAVKKTLEKNTQPSDDKVIWKTNFVRGSSKDSNRPNHPSVKPQTGCSLGLGTLADNSRAESRRQVGHELSQSRESSAGSCGICKRDSVSGGSSVETVEERSVTPIQSSYGVHWKSSAHSTFTSKIRRRNLGAGTILAPMGKKKSSSSKQPKGDHHHGKTERKQSAKRSRKTPSSETVEKETSELMGKLKIRSKVAAAIEEQTQANRSWAKVQSGQVNDLGQWKGHGESGHNTGGALLLPTVDESQKEVEA